MTEPTPNLKPCPFHAISVVKMMEFLLNRIHTGEKMWEPMYTAIYMYIVEAEKSQATFDILYGGKP